MQLGHVKYLNEMTEAYQNRVKSVALRKEILEKQKVRNYQNEYNRIRAHLEDSAVPYKTREGLKNRTEHLKTLGARALDTIS